MAGRFLILVAGASGRSKGSAQQGPALTRHLHGLGWRGRAVNLEGAQIWTWGPGAMPVARRGGALIVGHAFDRRRPVASVGSRLEGIADQLCRDIWGAYVAVWRAAEGHATWVFRDPSGARDLLCWRLGDTHVLASDLDHLPPNLTPRGLELDWDRVADFARRPASLAADLGLTGVTAIAPGEAMRLHDGLRRTVWRPADWACALAPVDSGEVLRDAVVETLEAWTGAFPRLATEVSGGFDSAVVTLAARASKAGDRLAWGLNYQGDRPEGDERRWAEQVVGAAKLPLLTVTKTLRALCEQDFEETAGGARPSLNGLDASRDRDTAQRLAADGVSALLTGYGGDAVFYQMPSALPLADYLRDRGWHRAAGKFPLDLARWLRRPIWSVLAAAGRGPQGLDRLGYLAGFLGPRSLERPAGPSHPWLENLEIAKPGKQLQLLHLATSQLAYGRSRRGDAAELIHPLMSQPVLEAGLAIPSWRHLEGGRDRALGREAFASLLPSEVATRWSKGTLTSYYTRVVSASLGFMRPYLLDGLLTTHGILDRRAMEAALTPDELIWRGRGTTLLNAAALEAWCRHWMARRS